ncbi:uncharacterized protein LOC133658440 isoform X2 [Entelurus aequoreus]|uniref:uncharacterized protein LOC133658440 isoform X2 n=1 Tax=Entelurus aequoreus TaxID=161455 RepID=UPI002B1D9F10|nr:uncharacterized protein LOC133658440 isoform X2 [Entelurus aequoreus]
MGIEAEAERTLFIRNLDARAGPLIKTKIPKDMDGKQKTFGFAVYKDEASVPYALQLFNGSSLFGRTIYVHFRSGSSPSNSTGNLSPTSTPNPHGVRIPPQFTTPASMQRSFSAPDNLQKRAMAGPLIRTKIPKDKQNGKQKTFGFAVYEHEVSVPYGMQLLNGSSLLGTPTHLQFRSGSSHSNSTGNSSPTSTPNPHGMRMPPQFTFPVSMQRSFLCHDNLQMHAMGVYHGSPPHSLLCEGLRFLPGDPNLGQFIKSGPPPVEFWSPWLPLAMPGFSDPY